MSGIGDNIIAKCQKKKIILGQRKVMNRLQVRFVVIERGGLIPLLRGGDVGGKQNRKSWKMNMQQYKEHIQAHILFLRGGIFNTNQARPLCHSIWAFEEQLKSKYHMGNKAPRIRCEDSNDYWKKKKKNSLEK